MAHQGLPRAASHGVVCPRARVHRSQRQRPCPLPGPQGAPSATLTCTKCSHCSTRDVPVNLTQAWGWGVPVPVLNVRVDQAKDSAAYLPEHGHARPVNVRLLQHPPAEPRGEGLVTAWWRRLCTCHCEVPWETSGGRPGPELAGALSAEPPGPGAPGPRGPCPPVPPSLRPWDSQPPNAGRGSGVTRVKGGSSSVCRAGGQGAGLPAPEASSVPSSWQGLPASCFL